VHADWLRATIGSRRTVITLDNHYVHGGQGQMIAAAVAALGLDASPRVIGLGVTSLPECGTNDEVLQHHGLDIPSLVTHFRAALERVAPGAPGAAVRRG
jgi:transketolase